MAQAVAFANMAGAPLYFIYPGDHQVAKPLFFLCSAVSPMRRSGGSITIPWAPTMVCKEAFGVLRKCDSPEREGDTS